jgi:hypothetical protein
VPQPDERAVQTLIDTFWSSAGWRKERTTPRTELAHAIARGVMFKEPLRLDHDDLVSRLRHSVGEVELRHVADAFLASLTSRRLDLRSVLGSYAVARHLPEHAFQRRAGSSRCAICDLRQVEPQIDRNVLNFERFKWGGVRRDHLVYVWHDLERFQAADHLLPSDRDRELFDTILDQLDNTSPETTAATAYLQLSSVPGTEDEREVLLDILGVCSILETPEHTGYLGRFVPATERDLPSRRFVDGAYPVCWWTAAHGANRNAAQALGLLA